jgi:hypothetical protein
MPVQSSRTSVSARAWPAEDVADENAFTVAQPCSSKALESRRLSVVQTSRQSARARPSPWVSVWGPRDEHGSVLAPPRAAAASTTQEKNSRPTQRSLHFTFQLTRRRRHPFPLRAQARVLSTRARSSRCSFGSFEPPASSDPSDRGFARRSPARGDACSRTGRSRSSTTSERGLRTLSAQSASSRIPGVSRRSVSSRTSSRSSSCADHVRLLVSAVGATRPPAVDQRRLADPMIQSATARPRPRYGSSASSPRRSPR